MRRHTPTANRRRGFTLLEAILYVAIVGVILLTVSMFAAEFISTQAKADGIAEVGWNSRFAAARVAAEIREARGYSPGASTFDSDGSVLVLLARTPQDEPVTFAVDAGTLTVTRGSGAPLPLTASDVEVTRFRVEDRSFAGRSRNLRVLVETRLVQDAQWDEPPTALAETTERVRRLEGFSN
jgi:type II secretory pathway pseudopilin PulG